MADSDCSPPRKRLIFLGGRDSGKSALACRLALDHGTLLQHVTDRCSDQQRQTLAQCLTSAAIPCEILREHWWSAAQVRLKNWLPLEYAMALTTDGMCGVVASRCFDSPRHRYYVEHIANTKSFVPRIVTSDRGIDLAVMLASASVGGMEMALCRSGSALLQEALVRALSVACPIVFVVTFLDTFTTEHEANARFELIRCEYLRRLSKWITCRDVRFVKCSPHISGTNDTAANRQLQTKQLAELLQTLDSVFDQHDGNRQCFSWNATADTRLCNLWCHDELRRCRCCFALDRRSMPLRIVSHEYYVCSSTKPDTKASAASVIVTATVVSGIVRVAQSVTLDCGAFMYGVVTSITKQSCEMAHATAGDNVVMRIGCLQRASLIVNDQMQYCTLESSCNPHSTIDVTSKSLRQLMHRMPIVISASGVDQYPRYETIFSAAIVWYQPSTRFQRSLSCFARTRATAACALVEIERMKNQRCRSKHEESVRCSVVPHSILHNQYGTLLPNSATINMPTQQATIVFDAPTTIGDRGEFGQPVRIELWNENNTRIGYATLARTVTSTNPCKWPPLMPATYRPENHHQFPYAVRMLVEMLLLLRNTPSIPWVPIEIVCIIIDHTINA
jgi:translation elongation factor EF-1alpha